MLSQSFSRFFILADYYVNKGYISKNLCENRDKPKMHCNGKCYLMKQIKENQKQEQSPVSKKEKPEVQLYFDDSCCPVTFSLVATRARFFSFFVFETTSFARFVFHPPTA